MAVESRRSSGPFAIKDTGRLIADTQRGEEGGLNVPSAPATSPRSASGP